MFFHRLLATVATAMLVSAPAALAQSPPLPAAGVLVKGVNGLKPTGHTHRGRCNWDPQNNGFRCLLTKGEWTNIFFALNGSTVKGCAFRVSQEGNISPGKADTDYFKIVRISHRERRADDYSGACVTVTNGRIITVSPGH